MALIIKYPNLKILMSDVFNIFFEIHVPKKASLLNLSTYTVNQHFSHSKQCSNIFQYEPVLEGLCYCSRFKKFRKKAQLKKNSAVNQFFTGKSQMNI